MQILSAKIVKQWGGVFALGNTPWKQCLDGSWNRHCGDVILRVDVSLLPTVEDPLSGCYVKTYEYGRIRLRVDGAVLPLSDDTVTALWELADTHLIAVGVLPKRPIEFPLPVVLVDFTKRTRSGVLYDVSASQAAIEAFKHRVDSGAYIYGVVGKATQTQLKHHSIDVAQIGVVFHDFEYVTNPKGQVVKIVAHVKPYGPLADVAKDLIESSEYYFGMRYTHLSDRQSKVTLSNILTWSLLPSSPRLNKPSHAPCNAKHLPVEG